MRYFTKRLFVCLLVAMSLTSFLNAQQAQFSIPITGSDNPGYSYRTVYFGRDPAATICRDSILGEEGKLPPFPPSFEMRWLAPRPLPCFSSPGSLGKYHDYRGSNESPIDTFRLGVSVNLWFTISWPALGAYYRGPVTMMYSYFDIDGYSHDSTIDMKAVLSITSDSLHAINSNIYIYAARDPLGVESVPVSSNVGTSILILCMIGAGVWFLRRRFIRITS